MRIGLIADTHIPGSIARLWPQAFAALRGVDVILHAGDLHTLDIVDELQTLAPVYVARGNGDDGIVDPRLRDAWMLEFDGVHVALIHHLPSPERRPREVLDRWIERHVGVDARPDVVVFGHTHLEGVYDHGELLCVNPGSPTLPRNQSLRFGTLGFLDIDGNADPDDPDPDEGDPVMIPIGGYELSCELQPVIAEWAIVLPPGI